MNPRSERGALAGAATPPVSLTVGAAAPAPPAAMPVATPEPEPERAVPAVVALIPAHDEEAQIAATIASVQRQTVSCARIIVLADNCTDRTVQVALEAGAEVYETVGNSAKKAGALNQGFRLLDDGVHAILQMDADTELTPAFLEETLRDLEAPDVGGVCARFIPKPGLGTTVWQRIIVKLQKIEYMRYDSSLSRMKNVSVLSGTACVYRRDALTGVTEMYAVAALEHVIAALYGRRELSAAQQSLRDQLAEPAAGDPRTRSEWFRQRRLALERHLLALGTTPPVVRRQPWNETSLVEDYRLTMDVKHLGYRALVGRRTRVYTDVPATLPALWRQRLRWSGGTFEELERHGWCRHTRRELLVFLAMALSVFGRLSAITLLVSVGLIAHGEFHWPLYWLIPILASIADRTQAIWRHEEGRWHDLLLSVSILPEELFALVREAYTTTAAVLVAARRLASW
jgi:poly-beta-1,6-N-acetyl-D-glucosamine synthase